MIIRFTKSCSLGKEYNDIGITDQGSCYNIKSPCITIRNLTRSREGARDSNGLVPEGHSPLVLKHHIAWASQISLWGGKHDPHEVVVINLYPAIVVLVLPAKSRASDIRVSEQDEHGDELLECLGESFDGNTCANKPIKADPSRCTIGAWE